MLTIDFLKQHNLYDEEIFDFPNRWNDNVYPLSQLYFEYENEDYCIDQLEVIGNVYENPELLEVGKGRSNRWF